MAIAESSVYGQEGVAPSWLMQCLGQIGYSYYDIFRVYDSLFEDRKPPFHQQEGQLFLLQRIAVLLRLWMDAVAQNRQVTFEAKMVDERVSRYLAVLSSIRNQSVSQLISVFQEIERKIRQVY